MATYYTTLFTRLGRLFSHNQQVTTFQGTLDTQFADTIGEFSGAALEYASRLSRNLQRHKDMQTAITDDIRAVCSTTLVETTDGSFNLTDKTIEGALSELIRAMLEDSKNIDTNTLSFGAASALGSNVGNGTLLIDGLSPVVDKYGNATGNIFLQNAKSETVTAKCTIDATASLVDVGSEQFIVNGQRRVAGSHQDWPVGSGGSVRVVAASAKVDGGRGPSQNICTNSNFELFQSNAPEHWSVDTGSAGTHVLAAGAGYNGDNALKFVGDGSTTPKISQTLNTTTGSTGRLNPNKAYSISCAVKYATAAPSVSINIKVVKSDGSTIYNASDAQREMSLNITSGSIGTSYALFSSTCFTPKEVEKGSKIIVTFSGNVANTSQVFIDDLVIAEMPRLGPGLPNVQLIPGSTAFRVGDQISRTVTNNYAGTLAKEFDRFFDMQGRDPALPSVASGNIADSLVS